MSIDEIEQRCDVLRQDLKVWEKKFAAQNNGRKAGRDDIKANAEICMNRHRNNDCIVLRTSSAKVQRVQQTTSPALKQSRTTDSFEANSKSETDS
jgi:hypothetical protein